MLGAEVGRLAGRLHVEDEVDVALLVADDILRAVLADGGEADLLEIGARAASGSGEVNSTNSKPSVPIGFSNRLAIGSFLDLDFCGNLVSSETNGKRSVQKTHAKDSGGTLDL